MTVIFDGWRNDLDGQLAGRKAWSLLVTLTHSGNPKAVDITENNVGLPPMKAPFDGWTVTNTIPGARVALIKTVGFIAPGVLEIIISESGPVDDRQVPWAQGVNLFAVAAFSPNKAWNATTFATAQILKRGL